MLIQKMIIKNLYKIRNNFFKDPNKNDDLFLIYAYLVGLFEGVVIFLFQKRGNI